MSEETYYTVLNVKETASSAEIKTSYRDLIKQVHPDTISNLAPYLRKIAEDKAKEIIEAYNVLSNSGQRRDYDRQLAEYRRRTTTQHRPATQPTPSPTSSTTSFGYCNQCGTSLYATGYCPKCSKFATPAARSPRPHAARGHGYSWAPLKRLSHEHPFIITFAVLFFAGFIMSRFPDADNPESNANTLTSRESGPQALMNNTTAASTGSYSEFPCDSGDKTSPIDGKPCIGRQDASAARPAPKNIVDTKSTGVRLGMPSVVISGAYTGTVHNQTVDLSSTFRAVIHQTDAGLLNGCMEVRPPLDGNGVLRGIIRGSHVNFVVADITFQGDASKTGITGSYDVARQEGNQFGDFRLTKQIGNASYGCARGAVVEFGPADATPKLEPVVKKPKTSPLHTF